MDDFLRNAITHSGIQDNLLQSYRTLSLSLQSILLALGIFMLSKLSEAETIQLIRFYLVPIYAFFIIGQIVSAALNKVVIHRGKDVSYWHKLIVGLEQNIDQQYRHFTMFKLSQQQSRAVGEYMVNLIQPREKPLTKDEIDILIGNGLGHTRKIVDRYIPYTITMTWFVVIVFASWIYWVELNK